MCIGSKMNGHHTIVKIPLHFGDAHFIPKMNFDPATLSETICIPFSLA